MLAISPLHLGAQVAVGGEGSKQQTKASVVSGQVFDTDGEPLAGVTIRNVNSKSAGCITDIDGKFRLPVSGSTRIAVSYIGKKPVEMNVTPGKPVKIIMEDDESKLSEVVVTGIYSRNKESFTGSSKTFDSSELKGLAARISYSRSRLSTLRLRCWKAMISVPTPTVCLTSRYEAKAPS